jgi:hypothetical protein
MLQSLRREKNISRQEKILLFQCLEVVYVTSGEEIDRSKMVKIKGKMLFSQCERYQP